MTIAELQKRIHEILTIKPQTTAELQKTLAPWAIPYDVLYTLRALMRMERIVQRADGKWEVVC